MIAESFTLHLIKKRRGEFNEEREEEEHEFASEIQARAYLKKRMESGDGCRYEFELIPHFSK